MSDDIPFDKRFDLPPGQVEEVVPGVRRILCNNPGPFTFKGTVVLHRRPRPGRDHRSRPARRGAYRGAARCGARRDRDAHLRHPHPSRPFAGVPRASRRRPARRSMPKGRTARRGRSISARGRGSMPATTPTFGPTTRSPTARWSSGDGWTLEAVTTPGHTANHMALRLRGTGTAVLRRSRDGLVDAGGGAARRRDERLHGVARRSSRGAAETDLSARAMAAWCATRRASSQHYIRHRKAREASILHRLAKGEADIPTMVRAIYIGLDPRLTKAAGLSVLAHLEDLVARGEVATDGPPSIGGTLPLAADRSWRSARPSWSAARRVGPRRLLAAR